MESHDSQAPCCYPVSCRFYPSRYVEGEVESHCGLCVEEEVEGHCGLCVEGEMEGHCGLCVEEEVEGHCDIYVERVTVTVWRGN